MPTPDYTKYSLEELRDALSHIDRERWPERVQLLDEEIKRRRTNASSGLKVDEYTKPDDYFVNFDGRTFFRDRRDSRFIPYHQFEYLSPLPLPEIIQIIKKNIAEEVIVTPFETSLKTFKGRVGKSSFRINKIRHHVGFFLFVVFLPSAFLPEIEGKIVEMQGDLKTKIMLRFKLHPLTLTVMIILVGLSFLAFLNNAYRSFLDNGAVFEVFLSLFFLVLGLWVTNFGFWSGVDESKKILSELFQAKE